MSEMAQVIPGTGDKRLSKEFNVRNKLKYNKTERPREWRPLSRRDNLVMNGGGVGVLILCSLKTDVESNQDPGVRKLRPECGLNILLDRTLPSPSGTEIPGPRLAWTEGTATLSCWAGNRGGWSPRETMRVDIPVVELKSELNEWWAVIEYRADSKSWLTHLRFKAVAPKAWQNAYHT